MISVDQIDREFWGLDEITETIYRVATRESDYWEAEELIRANNWPMDYRLQHPTILAERDGVVIGCIATRVLHGPKGVVLLAGPLAMLPGQRRSMTAWKLLNHYERALRIKGVTKVCFDMDKGSMMERCVLRTLPNLKPYHETETVAWYVWDLNDMNKSAEVAA